MNVTNGYFSRQPPVARFAVKKIHTNRFVNGSAPTVDGNDFLMHFGIPGQKWGVRRYQNEDGSLTDAGKARYNDDRPESERWEKNEAKRLSDEELNRRNNRLQREQTYRNLTTTDRERERKTFNSKLKEGLIKAAITTPILALATVAGTALIKKHGLEIGQMIGHYAKRKVAPLKAAGIMKNFMKKNPNAPADNLFHPLKDYALKKHPSWGGIDWIRRVGQ